MEIKVIAPPERLSDIVKCYWTLEKGNKKHIERLFPCGESQFIFHYRNPFAEIYNGKEFDQPRSLACGQFTAFKDIISNSDAGLIGVLFHSYSLKSVLHIPADELTSKTIDLKEINSAYSSVEQRINEIPNLESRIKVISDFLLKHALIKNKRHFDLVKDAANSLSKSSIDIKTLADKYSLSIRQFERIFNDHIGVSPKHFREIMRFKGSFNRIKHIRNLTDLSYESGYYDQSHFIRSFKKFTGYSPGEYLKIAP